MRFTEADRQILQGLIYDPLAEPSYELLRACLIWPDERPVGISNMGYELLGKVWSVRGFLHRHVPAAEWGLDPAYFQEAWRDALNDVPGWPGFKRLELSERDREYLQRCTEEVATAEDY